MALHRLVGFIDLPYDSIDPFLLFLLHILVSGVILVTVYELQEVLAFQNIEADDGAKDTLPGI